MRLSVDPDVEEAAAFLQRSFAASKLVAIASALAELAPLLWGHYLLDDSPILKLIADPISPDDQRTRSTANE